MKLHGYIQDQRLHTMHKSHNAGCFCTRAMVAFVQELFALDSSAKFTSHASDE